ncbi:MAG TPA: DUF2785 domain-containing protein [Lysinibacillus sp.]|uniref:DUF2785 domain-containing protein n=1 Tax=Lysinibacillus TaxID=400634 RepID=UPI00073880EE|nr:MULTISPECIES: DUF2785 domain-containing protein [unclassified Lysinibacillus]KUF29932.1 hypothetical protein AK833_17850 [Lysinibacillus sp. F5]MEE3805657.1 DUF2785 domain-containing protein [Lysinibacillus fusiformis]HBT70724.1 DUF2785 domain-containing protein [Lysinibacillus sp.]
MNIKETLQSFSTMTLSERQALMLQHSDWLLQEMLAHIGSVDAELRDHLIYRTFIELLSDNLLTPQQLHYLFETAISEDFLYLHIGEKATDSVFTRSFSALLVAGLLAKDAELLVLNDDDLHIFFKKIGRYLLLEQDIRGYVQDKGWAHSIAHGADLAATTIKHPKFDLQYAPSILHALKLVTWKDNVYINDEEERLINIVDALLQQNYSEEALIEFVEQAFDRFEMHLMTQGYNNSFFSGRTCTLNFMKTLYFSLKMNNKAHQLQNTIYGQVSKWLKLGD